MNTSPEWTATQLQTLALAGLFQAGTLADALATQGRCDTDAFNVLIENVLDTHPSSYEAIFSPASRYLTGLQMLHRSLEKGQDPALSRPLSYSLGLLHLARKLQKTESVREILGSRLTSLNRKQAHFPDMPHSDLIEQLADIYVDTLGSFQFRIRVQGEPAHLQNDAIAARIRALFLAGVRYGVLWEQAGGRKRHLIFSRSRIKNDSEKIIKTIS